MTLPRRLVTTAHGPLQLWGHFSRFDPARPLVLCIRGAFAAEDQMAKLHQVLPDADVIVADLPGMDAPHFDEPSVAAFAEAFDEMLARDWAGRRVLLFGVSTGSLVALAMRRGQVVVAMDPPLSTAAAWPLAAPVKRVLAQGGSGLDEWFWQVFGISLFVTENRDYRPLVERLAVPAFVIVAQEPLEPERPMGERFPGLVSAEDRRWLSASPRVQVVRVPGGHNVIAESPQALARTLRIALAVLPLQAPAA